MPAPLRELAKSVAARISLIYASRRAQEVAERAVAMPPAAALALAAPDSDAAAPMR